MNGWPWREFLNLPEGVRQAAIEMFGKDDADTPGVGSGVSPTTEATLQALRDWK